ncbi:MAG: hypothetical protein ACJAS9_002314 [Polaribacter sp.]|jgi:hypothetical protein
MVHSKIFQKFVFDIKEFIGDTAYILIALDLKRYRKYTYSALPPLLFVLIPSFNEGY